MFRTIISLLLATSFYRWFKPKAKNLIILIIVILLTLYLHNEYLDWSDQSNNKNYIGVSYIIKNVLLCLSIGFYLLLIRVQYLKNKEYEIEKKKVGDGFDKFRNIKKLRTKSEQIYSKEKEK